MLQKCSGLRLIEHYVCSCEYTIVSYPKPWHLSVRNWPGAEEVLRWHRDRRNTLLSPQYGACRRIKIKERTETAWEAKWSSPWRIVTCQPESEVRWSPRQSQVRRKGEGQHPDQCATFTGRCRCARTPGTPLKSLVVHRRKRHYRSQNIPAGLRKVTVQLGRLRHPITSMGRDKHVEEAVQIAREIKVPSPRARSTYSHWLEMKLKLTRLLI